MEEDLQDHDSEIEDVGPEELKQVISKLAADKADLEDRYLRKHADFENYRKRMTKEKAEAIQYANTDLMRDLVNVLDNLQRAQEASLLENADLETVRKGVQLIR